MTTVYGSSPDDVRIAMNFHNLNGMPPAEARMLSLGATSYNLEYQNQKTTNGDRLQTSESWVFQFSSTTWGNIFQTKLYTESKEQSADLTDCSIFSNAAFIMPISANEVGRNM
jgi:hypothetical protein